MASSSDRSYHDIKMVKDGNMIRGYRVIALGGSGIPATQYDILWWENNKMLKEELAKAHRRIATLSAKVVKLEGRLQSG